MTDLLEAQAVSGGPGIGDAIRSVSLNVAPSEIVGIIGPNGAGKTTLLRLLTGDLTPTTGTVRFLNQPLSEWRSADRAQRISVLPQFTQLDFDFSVREVVAMGRLPHTCSDQTQTQVIDEQLEVCGLQTMQNRPYTQLSGGERQRVQLARSFAQISFQDESLDRSLLVLDEPLSSVDWAYQGPILNHIKALSKRGLGVVMTLHDLNRLTQLADRIAVLQGGNLLLQGSPVTVLTEALLEQVFGLQVAFIPHPKSDIPWVVPL